MNSNNFFSALAKVKRNPIKVEAPAPEPSDEVARYGASISDMCKNVSYSYPDGARLDEAPQVKYQNGGPAPTPEQFIMDTLIGKIMESSSKGVDFNDDELIFENGGKLPLDSDSKMNAWLAVKQLGTSIEFIGENSRFYFTGEHEK